MTYNEIMHIWSLCQLEDSQVCETCPLGQSYPWCDEVLRKETLDLINRQKAKIVALQMDNRQLQSDIANANMNADHALAEIDRLTEDSNRLKKVQMQLDDAMKMYHVIKAEAVKEFAERIKKHCTSVELNAYIDSIVEEMVGDNNG